MRTGETDLGEIIPEFGFYLQFFDFFDDFSCGILGNRKTEIFRCPADSHRRPALVQIYLAVPVGKGGNDLEVGISAPGIDPFRLPGLLQFRSGLLQLCLQGRLLLPGLLQF